MYGIDGKIRKKYSNFREFSSKSSNYHNAYAPGSGTIVSLPQMLMGKKLANVEVCGNDICIDKGGKKITLDFGNNLFTLAKKNNFKTALIGWAHKYCEQYEASLDFCRSYGLYNFSSFYSKFSILNPIYTNIIMLPHQMPFGLLKNPVYSNLHHKNNINVKSLILDIIEKSKDGSVFTFVHHNLPHSPFIYKDDTYKPGLNPFQQSMEKYEAQLLYLDKQFGDLINKIKSTGKMENSTIAILSDHGFRILDSQGNSQGKKDHVPMIVYKGNNPEYIEIKDKVKTEKILFSLLEENL